jgi:hypothetical protein
VAIRVLLADDHAVVRAGIRVALEEAADIEIVGEAADGAEVQRLTAELRPDTALPAPPPTATPYPTPFERYPSLAQPTPPSRRRLPSRRL